MNYDVIIAGAGIVGLSSAYQLLNINPDLNILVLEKESDIATQQTGHNSGVIHSGIYYKPGSYKAKNCILGYRMLIDFCKQYQIEYKLLGKLIVATKQTELDRLHNIYKNGIQNGLEDLKLLTGDEVKIIEPNVNCIEAILVPQSGIVDYKKVALQLKKNIEQNGSVVLTNKHINSIHQNGSIITICNSDNTKYSTKFFINCAGLQSDRIAKLTGLKLDFRIIPFKGNYYKLKDSKKDIVQKLIYPVPDPQFPFLGIHYTRLINGDQTLGPNAELALDREGYQKNSFKFNDALEIFGFAGFWKLIGRHWKIGLGEYSRNYSKHYFAQKASEMTAGIQASDLEAAGCGIRAQVVDKHGNMLEDFVTIRNNKMIHVCNAPSPAATAGLAIGMQIAQWYNEMN